MIFLCCGSFVDILGLGEGVPNPKVCPFLPRILGFDGIFKIRLYTKVSPDLFCPKATKPAVLLHKPFFDEKRRSYVRVWKLHAIVFPLLYV